MSATALTSLLRDLLTIAAGNGGDPAAWRREVLSLYGRYTADQIHKGFDALLERRLVTVHGTPRTGWLTLLGHEMLIDWQVPRAAAVAAAPACADPTLTFRQFERQARHAYWSLLLTETKGDVKQAQARADVHRNTVYQQLADLGIRAKEFRS